MLRSDCLSPVPRTLYTHEHERRAIDLPSTEAFNRSSLNPGRCLNPGPIPARAVLITGAGACRWTPPLSAWRNDRHRPTTAAQTPSATCREDLTFPAQIVIASPTVPLRSPSYELRAMNKYMIMMTRYVVHRDRIRPSRSEQSSRTLYQQCGGIWANAAAAAHNTRRLMIRGHYKRPPLAVSGALRRGKAYL